MVNIKLETDRAAVVYTIEALFVKFLRTSIFDVVAATYDESLSSRAAVYGTLSAPNVTANGVGSSSEATNCNFYRIAGIAMTEWARVVHWRKYTIVLQ